MNARPVLIALALAAPAIIRAQSATDERVEPELRVDAILSENRTALQLGGGLRAGRGEDGSVQLSAWLPAAA